ncbi:MAG TPA: Gfo/Idh/MocA family oxidoreductase [Clostridia bacterium]|nr:Gfo/Idh/MocA family oxidoreductase [Clostridia bacterium]
MKSLNIAIVGAGVWGETHAAIFREHPYANPVAICDLNVERAAALADKYALPAVYGSVKDMLRAGGFDAVSIVTPDHLHADIAVACATAGKHLLIEKPLATTSADVFRIVEAVRRHNVRAMVDLHNRWSPPFAQAKLELDAGTLGTLRNAYFRLNDTKWVATDMLPWAAKSSILWFLGSHSLDTLQWLFDDQSRACTAWQAGACWTRWTSTRRMSTLPPWSSAAAASRRWKTAGSPRTPTPASTTSSVPCAVTRA